LTIVGGVLDRSRDERSCNGKAPCAPPTPLSSTGPRHESPGKNRTNLNSNKDIDMAKGNNSHKKEVKKPKKEKPKPLPTRRGS
jgi:hypothetical protein